MRFAMPFVEVALMILDILGWIVVSWVVLSWVMFFATQTSFRWKYKTAFHLLAQLSNLFTLISRPFVRPFQRLLPAWRTGGFDWSPILVILTIYLIRRLLVEIFQPGAIL